MLGFAEPLRLHACTQSCQAPPRWPEYLHDWRQACWHKAQVLSADQHVTSCHERRQRAHGLGTPHGVMPPVMCIQQCADSNTQQQHTAGLGCKAGTTKPADNTAKRVGTVRLSQISAGMHAP